MTTALGPIAMAGSSAVPTQCAPASDRLWLTRWARSRCSGPPEPSDTTTNSSRWARRPCATMVLSWLTWPASRPLEPGAKLTATMVSARTGSWRALKVACWTTGLSAHAARPSPTSSTRGDRMALYSRVKPGVGPAAVVSRPTAMRRGGVGWLKRCSTSRSVSVGGTRSLSGVRSLPLVGSTR